MHSKYVIDIYERLLADVRNRLGSDLLGTPDELCIEWILKEGPLLDKQVLSYLDNKIAYEDVAMPDWLMPIWSLAARSTDNNESGDPKVLHSCDYQVVGALRALCLKELRQLLVFGYKAEHEPTNEQLKASQKEFEETDTMCGTWADYFSSRYPSTALASARRIVSSVIYRINWSEITPAHGPGGIFPNRKPQHKSRFTTYYKGIAEHYPYDQYFWSLPSFWDEIMVKEHWAKLSEETDVVAKLVAVPKDSRGPRLICVHPAESIWIQQGQRKLLEHAITNHPLTKGKINFTDQSVNGNLAIESSMTQKYVTLDLKEASDRISSKLVRDLFGHHASEYLFASRANKIQLLDGRVIELKKFAPMGNCLTFPVQSLVFFSLIHAGILAHYGIVCNDIYVFGDDILFPQQYYDGAIKSLIMVGLVPNHNKTFRHGFFRESCGVDAYKGYDITPFRLRKTELSRLDSIESLLSLANRMSEGGYVECPKFIYETCRAALAKKYKAFMPYSNSRTTAGLFEYVDCSVQELRKLGTKVKFDRRIHAYKIKTLQLRALSSSVRMGEWYHLLDSLNRLEQFTPTTQLIRTPIDLARARLIAHSHIGGPTEYPVPYRTRLQYGWTALPQR